MGSGKVTITCDTTVVKIVLIYTDDETYCVKYAIHFSNI